MLLQLCEEQLLFLVLPRVSLFSVIRLVQMLSAVGFPSLRSWQSLSILWLRGLALPSSVHHGRSSTANHRQPRPIFFPCMRNDSNHSTNHSAACIFLAATLSLDSFALALFCRNKVEPHHGASSRLLAWPHSRPLARAALGHLCAFGAHIYDTDVSIRVTRHRCPQKFHQLRRPTVSRAFKSTAVDETPRRMRHRLPETAHLDRGQAGVYFWGCPNPRLWPIRHLPRASFVRCFAPKSQTLA